MEEKALKFFFCLRGARHLRSTFESLLQAAAMEQQGWGGLTLIPSLVEQFCFPRIKCEIVIEMETGICDFIS